MASHYARPLHERFRPVAVRARADGWTEARQRAFVAGLGEGLSTADAARAVGMTERSANRLRARAGARSFAKAWDTAVALARPVPEARRPWRWRLHRWRGRIVHREVVWDDIAVRRALAALQPYRFGPRARASGDLSYSDGGVGVEQGARFRSFQAEHRVRVRREADAAAARVRAEVLALVCERGGRRRDARAAWVSRSLQKAAKLLSDALPHRSRQGRPSRSRPPHGWFGAPVARMTGPPPGGAPVGRAFRAS